MTDEERRRTMAFIEEQHAKFSADMERLGQSHVEADRRMDRLERVARLLIKAEMIARTQGHEQDKRFEQRLAALKEAQARTEIKLGLMRSSQGVSGSEPD